MALLMTATILLIIYLMFRNDIDEESGEFFNIMIKTAIYVAVANLAFLFIFHGSVSGKIEDRHKSANDAAVVQHTTATLPSVMPVVQPVAVQPVAVQPVAARPTVPAPAQ